MDSFRLQLNFPTALKSVETLTHWVWVNWFLTNLTQTETCIYNQIFKDTICISWMNIHQNYTVVLVIAPFTFPSMHSYPAFWFHSITVFWHIAAYWFSLLYIRMCLYRNHAKGQGTCVTKLSGITERIKCKRVICLGMVTFKYNVSSFIANLLNQKWYQSYLAMIQLALMSIYPDLQLCCIFDENIPLCPQSAAKVRSILYSVSVLQGKNVCKRCIVYGRMTMNGSSLKTKKFKI